MHALIDGGEETAAPDAFSSSGIGAARDENDEAGKVLVGAAQAVGYPRADCGVSWSVLAGVHKKFSGGVVEFFGVHGSDYGNEVSSVLEVR